MEKCIALKKQLWMKWNKAVVVYKTLNETNSMEIQELSPVNRSRVLNRKL